METATLVGCQLLFVAVGAVIGLTLWSRHIVEAIHRRRLKSLREIQRELSDGR